MRAPQSFMRKVGLLRSQSAANTEATQKCAPTTALPPVTAKSTAAAPRNAPARAHQGSCCLKLLKLIKNVSKRTISRGRAILQKIQDVIHNAANSSGHIHHTVGMTSRHSGRRTRGADRRLHWADIQPREGQRIIGARSARSASARGARRRAHASWRDQGLPVIITVITVRLAGEVKWQDVLPSSIRWRKTTRNHGPAGTSSGLETSSAMRASDTDS